MGKKTKKLKSSFTQWVNGLSNDTDSIGDQSWQVTPVTRRLSVRVGHRTRR
jgi:hypothetical protein